MSRREPRGSTGTRQNDALFEYEACMIQVSTVLGPISLTLVALIVKKKFLHANKAITK